MNTNKVLDELKKKYPGKKIIKNNKDNPTEILCEVDPSIDHPNYSLVVAVIGKSLPHTHKKSKETYKIIKGKLSLFIDNVKYELKEGEKMTISPGQTHWAEGNETWIECDSEPGWTFDDHVLEESLITTLILVRHGETEKNLKKKLHKTNDSQELNETGKEQIRKAAARIKNYNPFTIYCSKEKRASQSANIIADICNLKNHKIDGLQERDWGDFSGKTWPEIQKILDKMTLNERFNYVPPNGESWKQFDSRLKSRLDEIISDNKGKVVVVVTHGGAIRAFMPHILGLSKEESFKYDPDNASLTVFDYNGSEFIKKLVNDTLHLSN